MRGLPPSSAQGLILIAHGIALIEGPRTWQAFLFTMIIMAVSGLVLLFLSTGERFIKLQVRHAFLFVTLSWISAAGFGALPFTLSGSIPSYTDAFFETMSGFTTTGASILTEIEGLPRSILFWRWLTHWFGDMGIEVLTVALLPLLGVAGAQLFKAESPGPSPREGTPNRAQTAKVRWES